MNSVRREEQGRFWALEVPDGTGRALYVKSLKEAKESASRHIQNQE